MTEFEKTPLCSIEQPDLWVHVWASVHDGCLTVEGQDFGKAATQAFGSDEYEYYYNFNKPNTARLLALLADESGRDPKDEFLARFSGLDGCKALRVFCEKNGIPYSFSSYC
jgi:hypothetical protein